jgi:hypothetical protein
MLLDDLLVVVSLHPMENIATTSLVSERAAIRTVVRNGAKWTHAFALTKTSRTFARDEYTSEVFANW